MNLIILILLIISIVVNFNVAFKWEKLPYKIQINIFPIIILILFLINT